MSSVKLSTIGGTGHIAEAVLQVCTFTGSGTCSASTSKCSTVTSRWGSSPSDMFKLHPALRTSPVQAAVEPYPRHLEQQLTLVCKMQMDDGYMEQFPIGAIDHIGLPESTLPKEVCNSLSILHIFHATPSCCMYRIMMHSLSFTQNCVVSCRSYRFCPQITTHSWSWLTTSAAMPSQAR